MDNLKIANNSDFSTLKKSCIDLVLIEVSLIIIWQMSRNGISEAGLLMWRVVFISLYLLGIFIIDTYQKEVKNKVFSDRVFINVIGLFFPIIVLLLYGLSSQKSK
jgi:hypothetical protein